MGTISQDIRGALQIMLGDVPGMPPVDQRAYEGVGIVAGGQPVAFVPTKGAPWVRMTMIPVSGRAANAAATRTVRRGMFQVDLNFPPAQGTGDAEGLADAITAAFKPATRIPIADGFVTIDYAERVGVISQEPDWAMTIVQIGWRCRSPRN